MDKHHQMSHIVVGPAQDSLVIIRPPKNDLYMKDVCIRCIAGLKADCESAAGRYTHPYRPGCIRPSWVAAQGRPQEKVKGGIVYIIVYIIVYLYYSLYYSLYYLAGASKNY